MKLQPGFTIPGKILTDQDRKEYVLKLENFFLTKTGRKSLVSTLEEKFNQVRFYIK